MVEDGQIPGSLTVVSRRNEVAYYEANGFSDVDTKTTIKKDSLWRIYSMTKPITSLALMLLFEEGKFQLSDPVEKYIPAFRKMTVYSSGGPHNVKTVPAKRKINIKMLLTHTAGLSHGFDESGTVNMVDRLYKDEGLIRAKMEHSMPLEAWVNKLASVPLLYQPGSEWYYSLATDVCGRLVEVISGTPLDQFLQHRVFGPLRMADTKFYVPAAQRHRFVSNYMPNRKKGGLYNINRTTTLPYSPPPYAGENQEDKKQEGRGGDTGQLPYRFCAGASGLVSTAHDYLRFAQMLLNKGELDGVRIIGRKTLEFMVVNHLGGNRDIQDLLKHPTLTPEMAKGIGFGLGFAVILDGPACKQLASPGTFFWGGAASTLFFVDPHEELVVVFMTQLMFTLIPFRPTLHSLVYSSLVDFNGPANSFRTAKL
eukprot:CAMPEP_0175164162 /NCGR_PEP_ID=MMETSP0087-20121206/26229_1 /TAXON_ID=136419 /ORGANISM="Unknown Unknown, Strain D1" /LENGTH=423 /DNA_ID=CAMNT_0016453101 /DNA_START=86 /DNA_END=1357 /DNA_ORIENTATION=+